jgi:hypothetical protein
MRYVKYVGLSHQRMITAHDWQGVRITADTAVWNAHNGFAVPLDRFTEDQIRKAIDPDPNFVITGDDEDFTPVAQNRDMVPAEHAQAVAAPVDVVDMANTGAVASTDDSGASGAPGGAAPSTRTTGGGSTRTSTTAREA